MSTPATIGVMCLETEFTKIPGHIRNPTTFDFPLIYHVVKGATPERVVTQADPTLLDPFIDAARTLAAQGVAAITGACGFLALFQRELADAVDIPLYTSSLIQLPMVARMIRSDRKVGILTAKETALTTRHLTAVDAASVPVCVAGMQDCPEFCEVILAGRRPELDVARLEREVLGVVEQLAQTNRDMGALVIECTDLPPFAYAIQARLGIPVFDIVTLTRMVHQSLTRHPYGGSGR